MKLQSISEYVKALRKKEKLSLRRFAGKYNISHSQVSIYESGKLDHCSPAIACNFCDTFNISYSIFSNSFVYDTEKYNDSTDFYEAMEKTSLESDSNNSYITIQRLFTYLQNIYQRDFEEIRIAYSSFTSGPLVKVEYDALCKINNKEVCVIFINYRDYKYSKDFYEKCDVYFNLLGKLFCYDSKYNDFILVTCSKSVYENIYSYSIGAKNNLEKNISLVYCQYNREIITANLIGNLFKNPGWEKQ